MDIQTLCHKIHLPPEISRKVLDFEHSFDFNTVSRQLGDFLIYQRMGTAQKELKTLLGEDKDNLKILTCMLKASADAYEIYQMKGISDEIYFATMKCYPRFMDEAHKRTGRLYFDRDWWTARQAGCHLFRIGALEYERKQRENQLTISLHIPSDADFSPAAVEQSLEAAKEFFARHYPETKDAPFCCRSWLLDSQLKEMLGEDSNIISFQKRFALLDAGEGSTESIQWIFNRDCAGYADYVNLPEETSLQKKMKRHLLSGGTIRSAYGMIL